MPNINPIISRKLPPSGWWLRPADWIPMPDIEYDTAHGLFAVFEDEINGLAIQIQGGNHTIEWGDGSTDSTGSGTQTYNHVYDYSTLSGSSYVFTDGRNYKMVVVTIEFTNVTTLVNIGVATTPASGTAFRIQNWLDFQMNSTRNGGCQLQYNTYFLHLLERLNLVGEAWAGGSQNGFARMINLRVLGLDFSKPFSFQFPSMFSGFFSDVRDMDGNPISIYTDNISNINLQSIFFRSNITEVGDLTFTNGTPHAIAMMQESSIRKSGTITIPKVESMLDAFRLTPIEELNIVVEDVTNITRIVLDCFRLTKLVMTGSMANVTITGQAFVRARSLRKLILTGITVGFDIRDTQVSGQNLQDLFTSLGNANGSQTITLPNFTIGESTTIATNKGYTIAYA